MSVENIVKSQKAFFLTNQTKDINYRKNMLQELLAHIKEREELIYDALNKDLGKCKEEAYMTEIGQIERMIRFNLENIDKWSRPEKRKTPITHFFSKSYVYREPYGVTLILSPWNYPFYLAMAPLIAAITAGNCVVLKMSRKAMSIQKVVKELINDCFDSNYVAVLDINADYSEIMASKYDYIFFTGSQRVARIIMRQACENLTPITLELGGKNPCILDEDVNIKDAAKKIIWGKIINAGQTCIAPDYCLVPVSLHDEFIELCKKYLDEMIPNALTNPEYGKIVNLHHYMRLKTLITNKKDAIGGKFDDQSHKIELAIFPNCSFKDDVMQSEIFGPLLAVIAYDDIDEKIIEIKNRAKPLATYIFSKNRNFQNRILDELSFGGGCINNTMMHAVNENLPFGGVGESGMGKYHGKEGFDTFSNKKSIIKNSTIDINLRYPPYTALKKSWIYKLLR